MSKRNSYTRPCRECGETLRFVMTGAGKWTPQNEDGSSHWSTCPGADKFRKRKEESKSGDLFGEEDT